MFIDDQEKMIDFFILSKPEFLNFYSYLTEEEYEATKREVLKRSRYWNTYWADDNPDFDGRQLKDIWGSYIAIYPTIEPLEGQVEIKEETPVKEEIKEETSVKEDIKEETSADEETPVKEDIKEETPVKEETSADEETSKKVKQTKRKSTKKKNK